MFGTQEPHVPRHASTLVLLRDAADGLEVLMLRRHGLSDVLGGNFVFPGGKLDAADAQLDAERHLDASAATMHARLGEADLDASTATGFYVAALRETFEEAGLLMAHGVSSALCVEASARQRAGFEFNALIAELDLRLQADALVPWARWITPLRSPSKRFDTRFFVARAPDEGIVCHDGHETTEAVWLRPRPALESYWDGGMAFAPPQIMSLAHLARHASVDDVLAEARARGPVLVEPHVIGELGARTMCYPGDEAHPVRERGIPGPTRLVERGARCEPPSGSFEGYF